MRHIRTPKAVLDSLEKEALKENYHYERLYRNFYNKEFYYMAYKLNKEGNAAEDIDVAIENLIEKMRAESYQPSLVKKSSGIYLLEDRLIQEIIRSLLEAIYERKFSNSSHSFRVKRTCHTALQQISNYNGVKWYLDGNIKFYNLDHHILINILRKTIKDEKFINLIWKFIKAGYLEDWVFNKTYSGSPKGGIISSILANIYLNEFDKYVEEYINKVNLEQRISYTRYVNSFLIGIIGSKEDAKAIKSNLKIYLENNLKLELSEEKTFITYAENKVRFLGYNISVENSSKAALYKMDNKKLQKSVVLRVPQEIWIKKLKEYNALKIVMKNGKEEWVSCHRTYLKDNDDLAIFKRYNAEIKGLYNYYRLAKDVSVLNKFYHIMRYSFIKTLGNKYKTSVPKIIQKFNIDGNLAIRYETKKGTKIYYFYNEGFKRNLKKSDEEIDNQPNL